MNTLTPVVYVNAGTAKTTSKQVADFFEKRHDHVLRDIDLLLTDMSRGAPNFGGSSLPNSGEPRIGGLSKIGESSSPSTWFARTTYVSLQNREMPMFEMTKDGFALLAMGFTGAAALQFKLAYIAEFNRMAAADQGARSDELLRLMKRVEAKFPRFKPFALDYVTRALPLPDLCAKYQMSTDAVRRMGNAMVREGYVDEETLVKARRGQAAWNALLATRSQLALELAPASVA